MDFLTCFTRTSISEYVFTQSHNALDVGEMVDRDYDWSVFTKDSLYGVPTPHDNSGCKARDALHWMSLEQRFVL